MSGLQISPRQARELSDDVVRRHGRTLSQRADAEIAATHAPDDRRAEDAERLTALQAVLRRDIVAKTGPAAPYLVVDLDHTAERLRLALQAGARYREPAAAGLLTGAAALGAAWLSDERLYPRSPDPGAARPRPEPSDAPTLKAWAEGHWSATFNAASQHLRTLLLPANYSLGRAVALGYGSESLRAVADAVFPGDDGDRLARFMGAERALLAAAGLDAPTLGDRRVESLCIAADLVHGLGRFVRLALAAPDTDRLFDHLEEALHALAEHPEP